jgi:hypothetical protein
MRGTCALAVSIFVLASTQTSFAQVEYLDTHPFHMERDLPHIYYPPQPPAQYHYYSPQYAFPQSTPYAITRQYPTYQGNFGGRTYTFGGAPTPQIGRRR